jgi:hypothetical protein
MVSTSYQQRMSRIVMRCDASTSGFSTASQVVLSAERCFNYGSTLTFCVRYMRGQPSTTIRKLSRRSRLSKMNSLAYNLLASLHPKEAEVSFLLFHICREDDEAHDQ